MTALQKAFTEFIPSETMRKYLYEKISDGSYSPSAEDIAATVCQSSRDVSEKAAFLKLILDTELSESTFSQISYFQKLYEKVSAYAEDSRYAFECIIPDTEPEKTRVFNSLERMLKFTHKYNISWFKVVDKKQSGSHRYIAELFADNGIVYDVTDLKQPLPENPLSEKYVAYPIPFETGDVVCFAGSSSKYLYCVVNASQPEYNGSLNFVDASIMVIPYEYREYASPDEVRKHYERLSQPDHEADIITLKHEHMMIIYAELYCKGEYT